MNTLQRSLAPASVGEAGGRGALMYGGCGVRWWSPWEGSHPPQLRGAHADPAILLLGSRPLESPATYEQSVPGHAHSMDKERAPEYAME